MKFQIHLKLNYHLDAMMEAMFHLRHIKLAVLSLAPELLVETVAQALYLLLPDFSLLFSLAVFLLSFTFFFCPLMHTGKNTTTMSHGDIAVRFSAGIAEGFVSPTAGMNH